MIKQQKSPGCGRGFLLLGRNLNRRMDGFDDSRDRGHQNDSHCHDTGSDHQQGAFLDKAIHITLNSLLGGVVDVGAGDQGNQADDQIGNGWVFADSCHDLCICCRKDGAQKAAHGIAEAQILCKTENSPGQEAAHRTDPLSAAMDVPHIQKTGAGDGSTGTGNQR